MGDGNIMSKIVRGRAFVLHMLLMLCLILMGSTATVHAEETKSISLKVDKENGICEYTITGVKYTSINSVNLKVIRAADQFVAYEKKIPVSIDTCPDGTYHGSFSKDIMVNFQYTKYIVLIVAGEETITAEDYCDFSKNEIKNPVEWKLTVDSNTGSTTRTFQYEPVKKNGQSVDEGKEAALYAWKKQNNGAGESKAVLIGEKQVIGREKLVWKTDISKSIKDYGTYYVKLAVSDSEKQVTKATEHFIVRPSCKSFTTKVTNALEAQQSFGIYLSGLENPYGVKKVTFQVYNSKKVKVYSCSGKTQDEKKSMFYAAVSMKNLNYKLDKYTVKANVTDKRGNEKLIYDTAIADRRAKKGTIKITNQSDKKVKFTLKDAYLPGKIKSVSFKVYVKADGAKKAETCTAVYSSKTNTYTGTMSISGFKYKKTGVYCVQAYGLTKWNTKVLLNNSTFRITKATAQVKGKNMNSRNGTFDFIVTSLKSQSGVVSVKVKVWQQGKDGAVYSAKKQSNGTYKVQVNAAKHDYHFGQYHAKVLVKMGNGIEVCAVQGTYTFKPVNFVYFKDSDIKNSKKVYIYNPSKAGTVTFQVYSKTNGTDDSFVYKTVKSGSSYYSLIKLSEIKHAGTIIVKAKVNNRTVRTATFTMRASQLAKNGWHYETYQGKTYKFYYKDGEKVTDLTGILGIKESSDANVNNFRVEVNRAACCVTVYAYDSEKKAYCIPVKTCTVSVGRDIWTNNGPSGLKEESSYTPIGDFSISSNGTSVKYSMKPMHEPDGSIVYARWASHVVGNVYFHSIAVSSNSHYALNPNHYNKLGSPASAGCIRMTVADAKWFYDYVSKGTPVKIVTGSSSYPGPLGKNKTIKISSSIHYDPTDPEVPDSTKEKDYKAGRISGYMTSSGKKVGY